MIDSKQEKRDAWFQAGEKRCLILSRNRHMFASKQEKTDMLFHARERCLISSRRQMLHSVQERTDVWFQSELDSKEESEDIHFISSRRKMLDSKQKTYAWFHAGEMLNSKQDLIQVKRDTWFQAEDLCLILNCRKKALDYNTLKGQTIWYLGGTYRFVVAWQKMFY